MLKKNQIIAFVAFILFIPMLFVTKTNIFSLKNITKKTGLYDIKDYLVNVNIDAPKNLEGEYIIVSGTQYTVSLRFEEKKGKQFPNDGEMYYELPSGLNVIESQQSRFFDIMVRSGDENLVIHNNRIRIENGKVYIRWAMEDPNIEALFNKKNVYFYIDFKCMFDETTQIIKFNDNIDVTLTFDNENNISIDKESIVSNYEEGRIKYYVTIESHGNNRDVIITDNLVGNNFELLPYSFTATSNLSSGDQWSHSIVGNSYKYIIPSMSNGEVITISYEVIVKPSVREISLEQPYLIEKIHNDVSVRSSTNDNVNTDSIENEITFRPKISKTEGRLLSKEGNKEIVGWDIIINDDNLFDITGLTVKDIINVPERDYMKMSGEGIRVYVYDTNSHLIDTYEVPWDNDSLTKNDYSWEYMIPDTYNDELYSYTISYITEVDKSEIEETIRLYNTAYFEEETSSNYYETIKSSTNILEIDKNAKEIDLKNNEVTWEISIDVPENGISPATMVDTLPGKYNTYTSSFMYDDYIDGSLTVDNLIGEENYDLSLEGNRLTIDFYKDREKTEKGLFGFPNGRRIIIRLKTKINQEWVNMVNTASDYSGHTNYVDFEGKNDNASVIISPKKLEKKVEKVSEIIEGVEYEAYRYDIIFSNITEDTFEIEDIFDTELLGLLKEGYIGKISVCGGNIYYQGDCIDNQINYINTSSGIKFIFQPSDLKKDINGNYYPSYRLSYSLIPKNSAAINKLNEYAAKEVDGIYNIQNTAEWGGLTATTNAEYIYNGFSKQLEDDNNGEDDYYTFTLNINPSGKYMNNKNELEIHDIYANMSVDFSSININPSEGVSYYSRGNELIFTIPDGQPTTITYRARAIFAEDAREGDTVRISNTAYIKDLGYEQSTSKVVEKSISGGGGASDYYLDIIKVEGENYFNRLEGASFDFYDSDHNYITTLTTDNDGKIRILFENTDFYDFEVDKNYYFKEKTPPRGYKKINTEYRFKVSSDGYINYSDYTYTSGDWVTVKNYKEEMTELTIIKEWDDDNNQKGKRPNSIDMTLSNGDIVTLSEANGWTSTIEVPKYDSNNNLIEYTWSEPIISGYEKVDEKVVGGITTITNSLLDEKTSFSIEKIDSSDSEKFLAGAEFGLYIVNLDDDANIVSDSLLANGTTQPDGIIKFTDLDMFTENNNGQLYYFVETNAPEGYELDELKYYFILYDGGSTTAQQRAWVFDDTVSIINDIVVRTFTNDYTYTFPNNIKQNTVAIDVNKIWADNNDQDGIRPESITFTLLKNGTTIADKTCTANASTSWSCTIDNLDEYENGEKINYSIGELDLINGYETGSAVSIGNNSFSITNVHTPETTEATITKVWEDEDDQDGIRPTSITMQLLADGEEVEGKTATLTNDKLTDTITGLPKYNKSTTPINYTWSESTLPEGYEMTSNVTNGKITTITNTHISKTVEVTATKIWADNNNQDGIRPESITFTLLKNGTAIADKTCTAKASTNWSCTMDNLDEYENGEKINYSIVEMDLIEGYEASSAVSIGDNSFSITNVHTPAKTTFNVNKIWDDKNNQDGKRPNSITVHLLADGTVIKDYTLDESNNWMHTFENLDKYNNGKQIVYSVIEENIDYYSTSISGGTITNTYAPEKTSYTVIKRWEDANDQDGIRPDSINIALLANGEEVEEIELTSEKGWTHTFSNLDKYSSGEIIEYSVKEITVINGYNSEVSGNTIINQHTPELKSISGKKTWEDQDDFRKLRPKKITICLYADGIKQTCKDISIDDNWEYTFNDLPKYNRGIEINYSLVEEPVEYYKAEIDGYNITNKYTPKENSNDNRPPINNPVTKDRSIIVIIITAISYIGYILFRFKKKMVK